MGSEDFGSLIQFIILLLFTGISIFRRRGMEKKGISDTEIDPEVLEEQKMMMKALFGEEDERSSPPPPPKEKRHRTQKSKRTPSRTVSNNFDYHSAIEEPSTPSSIEKREFHSALETKTGESLVSDHLKHLEEDSSYAIQAERPSLAKNLVEDLPETRQMFLYHELFGPPKALRRSYRDDE